MAENTVESSVPAEQESSVPTRQPERYLTPAVDIYETDDGLVLVADLPGVDKEGLSVRVDSGLLTLQGKLGHPQRANAVYEEYGLLHYFREFRLGEEVDQEKIGAELKNGVLTLQMPKREQAKPKQIPVTVS
jgi:HSP20 family molecular chaperone IbpA